MHQPRNYSQVRARIARRRRTFLSPKERAELMQNLTRGMRAFVLTQKRKESASAAQVNQVLLND